eukprot:1160215-Pelagomonas_calceolata.AAC.3
MDSFIIINKFMDFFHNTEQPNYLAEGTFFRFSYPCRQVRKSHGYLSQCASFSSIDVGSVLTA